MKFSEPTPKTLFLYFLPIIFEITIIYVTKEMNATNGP